MGITPDRFTLFPRAARPCAWLGLALLVAFPGRASAQTAQDLYERALSQERAALSAPEPAPDALRKVAKLYEAVVPPIPGQRLRRQRALAGGGPVAAHV